MSNIKSISNADVTTMIATLDSSLERIKEMASDTSTLYECYKAVGYAEATIEIVIKQLKGEYPIF